MTLRPLLPSPASALRRGLVAALLGCLVSAGSGVLAAEAPVHRCGNSYSSQPCPDGTAVDVADPRSAAQQREAREASARDAALARQMKAQRLANERAAPKGGAANLGPVAAANPPAKAASKPHQHTHKKAKKANKLAKAASAPR